MVLSKYSVDTNYCFAVSYTIDPGFLGSGILQYGLRITIFWVS
jgi:hypothetical protein